MPTCIFSRSRQRFVKKAWTAGFDGFRYSSAGLDRRVDRHYQRKLRGRERFALCKDQRIRRWRPSRSCLSTGLVRCPSQPALMLSEYAPLKAWAVNATIGTRRLRFPSSQARISRVGCVPVHDGHLHIHQNQVVIALPPFLHRLQPFTAKSKESERLSR